MRGNKCKSPLEGANHAEKSSCRPRCSKSFPKKAGERSWNTDVLRWEVMGTGAAAPDPPVLPEPMEAHSSTRDAPGQTRWHAKKATFSRASSPLLLLTAISKLPLAFEIL